MASDNEFLLKAAALARAAPTQWDEFLSAFKDYAARRRDECVQAPSDRIFLAQGHAQRCNVLLNELTDCRKHADNIQRVGGR